MTKIDIKDAKTLALKNRLSKLEEAKNSVLAIVIFNMLPELYYEFLPFQSGSTTSDPIYCPYELTALSS